MYDVIECFQSSPPTKQARLIVFQTPNADLARLRADELYAGEDANLAGQSRITRAGRSTFVVVDRSTAVELYRVPNT